MTDTIFLFPEGLWLSYWGIVLHLALLGLALFLLFRKGSSRGQRTAAKAVLVYLVLYLCAMAFLVWAFGSSARHHRESLSSETQIFYSRGLSEAGKSAII